MNTKLLASIAVLALLTGIVGTSFMNSAYAMEDKMAKMDKKMDDKKAKMDKKMDDKKAKMDKKMDDKKAKMDKKMDDKKATSGKASGAPVKEATVEMAKGTATNQDCADKCYMPSTVTVAVGGKVTWKNIDSAAHTATASDGSFDTSLVNAGASASNTFNTAGSYQYMCIVHPWMKGTVSVQ